MDGLTVSQLAHRSGVPATTLRFYDEQGLLPARRSPSGYRLFDDVAVDRLAFIGTAKSLGLALPEIRRLLAPWDHGRCSDVQHALIPLVERRIAGTRERIRELSEFADRLVRAHRQLEAIERDGPCDPSCTSLGRMETVAGPALASHPGPGTAGDAAVACTLDAADREARARRWRDVLVAVTERQAIPGGVRLTFDPAGVRVGELAELAEAESQCCPFLDLSLHIGPPCRLEATAPNDALVLVHELFGAPTA